MRHTAHFSHSCKEKERLLNAQLSYYSEMIERVDLFCLGLTTIYAAGNAEVEKECNQLKKDLIESAVNGFQESFFNHLRSEKQKEECTRALKGHFCGIVDLTL